MKSPFRYPGGKARQLGKLLPHFPKEFVEYRDDLPIVRQGTPIGASTASIGSMWAVELEQPQKSSDLRVKSW